MSWPTKKLGELKYAEFFIERFNKRYDFDYQTKPNRDENDKENFVDIYAYSASEKHPVLKLQITTREGLLYKELTKLRAISKRTGKNVVMGSPLDMPTEEWIKDAVKKKEEKYSSSIKQGLILLIAGEFGSLLAERYASRVFYDLRNSEFQGIYSVHLPSSTDASNYPHSGQIIAIKDIYGNHGESF